MALREIERKFLVKNEEYKSNSHKNYAIVQGYLNPDPKRSVRVRIKGENGFLTVKGPPSKSGTTRFEWEKEIPVKDAKALLDLCEPTILKKTRYLVKSGKHLFEIDEFFGENNGLIVAEVELNSEGEDFEKPDWLGEEVTGDPKYYNAQLSKNPFQDW